MNEFDNRENLDNDREMNEKDVITEINSPIAESENAEKADSAEEQSQKTTEETPTASAEYSPTNQYSEFGNQGDSSGEQFNSAQPTMDFSPLNEVKEEKVSNTGLRVFICILAAAMLITGCLAGGYLAGRSVNIHSNSTVNLAPKPDVEKVQADETIYNNLKESVVGVSAYGADGKSRSSGSGVIYSSDGYIITNDHIYESVPSAKFLITTYDGIEYEATYVAGDTRSDLAVLKINVSGLKAAEFGDSSALNVGEKVVAVGYPAGVHERPIMTSGLISSVGRRVTTSTTYSAKFIQTDTAINPGSSGGALVNAYSQVVGITSAKMVGSEVDSIGFAIPSIQVKKIVDSLISSGYVKDRARLGVTYQMIDTVSAKTQNMVRGMYIASIAPDSGLYNRGVKEGDIITHINDQEVVKSDIALDIIDSLKAGDTVVMTIYNSEKKTSQNYTVPLIEDKGSSSYKEKLTNDNSSSSSEQPGFNFPFGE